MIAKAYCCLVIIWAERHITVSWKRKWLVPTPKNAPLNIKAVHLHKLWTGLIVQRINISLLNMVLNPHYDLCTFRVGAPILPIFCSGTTLKLFGRSAGPTIATPWK